MIHPHDDEPDPTHTWVTTTFPRCYLSFLSGVCQLCLYCQSTKSTNLKGVHSQSIFKKRSKDESRFNWTRKDGRRYVPSYDEGGY